jgi:hypothetical protein
VKQGDVKGSDGTLYSIEPQPGELAFCEEEENLQYFKVRTLRQRRPVCILMLYSVTMGEIMFVLVFPKEKFHSSLWNGHCFQKYSNVLVLKGLPHQIRFA